MIISYIGLGSNLGDRKENIEKALNLINAIPSVKIEKASSFYQTQPQGCPAGSPPFLNAALKIKTSLSVSSLLRQLQGIENKLGRKRTNQRFSARTIDLDILIYGKQRINRPHLRVPHPRLRERPFVLKPLGDIAPELISAMAKEIPVVSGIAGMREVISGIKKKKKTIGFVPTMGYLHQGHLSLIRQAKKDCDVCVLSIFVNPIQFGPREDYKKYPRDMEQDSILAKSAGCDYIFHPQDSSMYPRGYQTYVNVEKLTEGLCGLSRPGHFKGVATVVAKLFNIIQPDIAYFGEKDYQQAMMIKKMTEDLNMPLKIRLMPIVREADGLALSSRNSYLSPQERADAVVLYQSLLRVREWIRQGEISSGKIISRMKEEILTKKSARIDYIAVVDAGSLQEAEPIKGNVVIALAVWIGKTRLIDNITLRCG